MSHDDDDYRTPLPPLPVAGVPGVPSEIIAHRLKSVEVKFGELKRLVERNKEILIETVGSSGKDGKMAWMSERLEIISKEIEAMQVMFEEQRRYIAKIVMAMLVTSGLGAGGAQVIMKLVGGG
tara:strand:+ start:764 stop:1132 length:369 start_codon:yes stop_codon:yes gene_type:complete